MTAEVEEELRKLIVFQQSKAVRRRDRRNAFWMCVGFSAFVIGYLIWKPPTFPDWREWIIAGGAILFAAVTTTLAFFSMRNDWTTEKEERVLARTLGWLMLGPFVVVVSGVVMYSVFGWLDTIP